MTWPEPVRKPISVLAALKAACTAHPDQRVLQVVVNALDTERNGTDLFYVEDVEALKALTAYAKVAPDA